MHQCSCWLKRWLEAPLWDGQVYGDGENNGGRLGRKGSGGDCSVVGAEAAPVWLEGEFIARKEGRKTQLS
jgi:hypothetical protein